MRILVLSIVLVSSLAIGCSAPGAEPGAATPPAASVEQPRTAPSPQQREVAKVVFIGKENCCECTQKAIDNTRAALDAVLAGKPLPVERFNFDTQPENVGAFLSLRRMVAVPALYLFDKDGGLIDVLQGESDEAKLRTYLN